MCNIFYVGELTQCHRVCLLRAPADGRGACEPGLPAGQGAAH